MLEYDVGLLKKLKKCDCPRFLTGTVVFSCAWPCVHIGAQCTLLADPHRYVAGNHSHHSQMLIQGHSYYSGRVRTVIWFWAVIWPWSRHDLDFRDLGVIKSLSNPKIVIKFLPWSGWGDPLHCMHWSPADGRGLRMWRGRREQADISRPKWTRFCRDLWRTGSKATKSHPFYHRGGKARWRGKFWWRSK